MSDYIYTKDGELYKTNELKHGFSKQGHKYIYREKGPDGSWRYYYKKEEIKGPRGNDRRSGTPHGTYVDKTNNLSFTVKNREDMDETVAIGKALNDSSQVYEYKKDGKTKYAFNNGEDRAAIAPSKALAEAMRFINDFLYESNRNKKKK